jgi:HAD superfamily hydrolase (TIGR01490 family)
MSKHKPPVAVFDIDGTIFRSSLVIELTHELLRSEKLPEHVKDEYLASRQRWLDREGSYENYIQDVVAAFNKHTVGMEQQIVRDVARQVIERMGKHTYRFTRRLIDELKSSHFLLAISGSPQEVVALFAQQYGFEATSGKIGTLQNGKYTGGLQAGTEHKDKILKQFMDDYGLTYENSVGVGDTESDAAFLELVQRPVAFNPNRQLFDAAQRHGWEVIVERKDVVYQLKKKDGAYVLDETDR